MRSWTERLMSRCRVCGSSENVACYDPRGLWAYFFRSTYCPECCPEHDYIREPGEGMRCRHCSEPPDADWYYED